MAKAYYSTVLDRPAQDVWEIIRDFNNYPVWVGGTGETDPRKVPLVCGVSTAFGCSIDGVVTTAQTVAGATADR